MRPELYIVMLLVIVIIICYLMMVYNARSSGRTFHEDLLTTMYGGSFPEEDFAPSNSNYDQYYRNLMKGKALASQEVLNIGGLAYNLNDQQVNMLEQRLEYVSQGWSEVHFFIYGLDSKEPFRSYLMEWADRDHRVHLVPALEKSWKDVSVFTKMSHLRDALHNHILQHIEQHPIPKEQHFILTMDYDMGGPISREGLYHARTVISDPKVGAVYANGVVSDSFLNTIPGLKGWCYPGLGFTYYDDLAVIVEHDDEAKFFKWYHLTRGRGTKPIPVKSAYGGAGLYRYESLKAGKYDLQAKQCEHHSFNASLLKSGYTLLVDPSFLVLAGCQGHHITRKI